MTCTWSDTETEQGPSGEVVTIRVDGTVRGYQVHCLLEGLSEADAEDRVHGA